MPERNPESQSAVRYKVIRFFTERRGCLVPRKPCLAEAQVHTEGMAGGEARVRHLLIQGRLCSEHPLFSAGSSRHRP